MSEPPASILIPTRDRADYLDVALASIAPQARDAGAELIVIDDGPGGGDALTARIAQRHGARLARSGGHGANAARNTGVAAARGALLVFVDDDVRVPAGWLSAVLQGAAENPADDVFGGPIRAELEGGGPHGCGRERPPITTLDLGGSDRDAELVWSANMAIRRDAMQRVGPFDESIHGRGEEEDWQRRHRAAGGRTRYLAAAGLTHRRTRADSRLVPLMRAGFALGRTARRYDGRKGQAPAAAREVRVLLGCLWHVVRRRCVLMLVGAAQAAGRITELLQERRG